MKTLTLLFMLGFISFFKDVHAITKSTQTLSFSPIGQKIYGDKSFSLICQNSANLPVLFSSNNNNVISIVNNTASIVGAGSVTITAYAAGNNLYESATTTQIVTVYKKDLYAIAKNKIKTYGQINPTFDILFTGFVNGDNISTIDVTPSAYVDQNKFSDAGNYPIKLTNSFDNNYTVFGVEGIFTINKAPLSAKAKDIFVPFGEEIPAFECEITGFVNNDNISNIDALPTIVSNVSLGAPVGEYILSIYSGTDKNYEFNTHIGGLLIVEQAPQVIQLDNLQTIDITQNNEFALPLTSSAGLPIQYSSSDINIAEIVNNKIIAHRTGVITITAEQEGDNNYMPAESISKTVAIQSVNSATSTVKKVDEKTIQLYPNPVIDEFNIQAPQTINHIEIYNIMGVLIYQTDVNNNTWQYQTSNIPKGQYLIQLKFTDNSIGSKLLTVN
jgi:hypothetical protein